MARQGDQAAPLLEQLAALLQQYQGAAQPSAAGPGPQPVGVAVPVEIQTARGLVTLYVSFAPEVLANPIAVFAALEAQGLRVRAWQPRFGGGFGRGGGGGYNGGYGGGRGFGGGGW